MSQGGGGSTVASAKGTRGGVPASSFNSQKTPLIFLNDIEDILLYISNDIPTPLPCIMAWLLPHRSID